MEFFSIGLIMKTTKKKIFSFLKTHELSAQNRQDFSLRQRISTIVRSPAKRPKGRSKNGKGESDSSPSSCPKSSVDEFLEPKDNLSDNEGREIINKDVFLGITPPRPEVSLVSICPSSNSENSPHDDIETECFHVAAIEQDVSTIDEIITGPLFPNLSYAYLSSKLTFCSDDSLTEKDLPEDCTITELSEIEAHLTNQTVNQRSKYASGLVRDFLRQNIIQRNPNGIHCDNGQPKLDKNTRRLCAEENKRKLNRDWARRDRKRTKQRRYELEQIVSELTKANGRLEKEVKELKEMKEDLRNLIFVHKVFYHDNDY